MCAPRRHGNRSIFPGVTRALRFQTFPGRTAKRLSFLWQAVPGTGPVPRPPVERWPLLPGVGGGGGGTASSSVKVPPALYFNCPLLRNRKIHPQNFGDLASLSLPFPCKLASKTFNHQKPSPKTVGTQLPLYPNGNPLLPPPPPRDSLGPHFSVLWPLGVRRPSSVNNPISKPPFLFIFLGVFIKSSCVVSTSGDTLSTLG